MKKERCINCDELTDKAGQFEDSLFACDYGPLCIDCHSVLDFGCLEIFDTKIKQLEADSGNWEAAYKTCAKSEDKLIEENQRLTEAIEFVENRAQLLIGVLEEDGERSYTGFVKEIKNRAQKALEGK